MATNKRLIKSNDEGGGVAASFNTVLYTGTGATNPVTGVGFQPDFVWLKKRSGVDDHFAFDSIRGAKSIYPNLTNAEDSFTFSFDTDGFTVPVSGGTNGNGDTFVAWCWKAGGAAVAAGGTNVTNRLVSANPEAGFSIMTYTGVNTDGTIEHGLNQAPEFWVFKNRTLGGKPWFTLTTAINGSVSYGYLNTTDAFDSGAAQYVTNTVIGVNTDGGTGWLNQSGSNYVCYAFHSVAGFSKFGSYTGNGGTQSISLGFEPAFVLLKSSSNASNWYIFDNKRGAGYRLFPDLSNAEDFSGNQLTSFNTDGFSLGDSGNTNSSGATYIYMAFANQF